MSDRLISLLDTCELACPLSEEEAEQTAQELGAASDLTVYRQSIAASNGRIYFLGRDGVDKFLCVFGREAFENFDGTVRDRLSYTTKICPRNHHNAMALRDALPFTAPIIVGARPSFGAGDRLGLATPGHIRAIQGSGLTPILAQQSMREMTRTLRSPEGVMDDATWGVFEMGYRCGFGSDADHLKSAEDIDRTFAAGFKLFTIDPGQYVDNDAERDSVDILKAKLQELPWNELETTPEDFLRVFAGRAFSIAGEMKLPFSEEDALRAAVKYGRPIGHTKCLYRHLEEIAGNAPFEIEMSVDETDSPTTVHEHFYIAYELDRLGVKVAGLAPRFLGDFEKGIEYKGDIKTFEQSFIQHVQIARRFDGYKISIHSGSDKFSIYPIVAKHAGGLAHVKTAGTSYLEALRAIAEVAPELFREILDFAFERYEEDKASYHVSARPEILPRPGEMKDAELAGVLNINDGRQLLHVTYGSVLTVRDSEGNYRFRDRLYHALRANEETHYEIVARHLRKHICPFAIDEKSMAER